MPKPKYSLPTDLRRPQCASETRVGSGFQFPSFYPSFSTLGGVALPCDLLVSSDQHEDEAKIRHTVVPGVPVGGRRIRLQPSRKGVLLVKYARSTTYRYSH